VPANPNADFVPPASTAPGSNGVLVVEDNFGVANALATVIRRAGFDATACHRGSEALEHVRHTKPRACRPRHSPARHQRLVLAHKIRDHVGGDVPIIIVSGDTSMETIKSLSHVGATYFFSKPVNPNVLVARLKELVDGGAGRE
jgi:DNA-binding response OmpR family regulator